MSKKKVTTVIGKDGKDSTLFEGFAGNDCYVEAEKIKSYMKTLGIEFDDELIIPTVDETTKQSQIGGVQNEQKH